MGSLGGEDVIFISFKDFQNDISFSALGLIITLACGIVRRTGALLETSQKPLGGFLQSHSSAHWDSIRDSIFHFMAWTNESRWRVETKFTQMFPLTLSWFFLQWICWPMLFQLWLILYFSGLGKMRKLYITRVSLGLLTTFEDKAISKLLTSEQLRVHFLGPFQLYYTRTSEGKAWVSSLYQVHPGVVSRTWRDTGGCLCCGRCTHMAWKKKEGNLWADGWRGLETTHFDANQD